MRRRSPIVLVVTMLVCATGAGGALAAALHTQTVTASGVTASFSFRGAIPSVTGARLKISRHGQTVYDAPVTSRACGTMCGPLVVGRRARSVGIVPLLPGSPDVVLELYTGGANCCVVDQVFHYLPAATTYVKTEHNFASVGARLERLNRRWRFVSADDGFKYAFTDGADSGDPIQIWSYKVGVFTDVTRSYPGLIRADATRWLRLFDHHIVNGVGLIAAWAGDQELLGHDALVQSTLERELARGRLRAGPGNFFPGGAKFIRELNRVLRQLGYKH